MPTNDLETKDPQLLLDRIHRQFPELRWRNYRYLNHGWDHEVIILDEKLVFRFPNSSAYLQLFKDESALLALISQTTAVRVPNYNFMAADQSFGGYQLIPGAELTPEVFHRFSEEEADLFASQLAGFLTALHTIPIASLTACKVRNADQSAYSAELRQHSEQYLPAALSAADYRLVQKIMDAVDAVTNQQTATCLTHGDISEDHLIWDEAAKKLGVIDFSDRSISDPAVDFAELLLYSASFATKVFELYHGPKDADLLQRAGVYLQRIGVALLVDSFITDKITFEKAKSIFDMVTSQ
jgi:aminoglycoside 2''-phosphotransferase